MNKGKEKNFKEKQLMFCLSKWLPKEEAFALAKSMKTNDKWYIYKISENSKARHIKDREGFVVVRAYRRGETVRAGGGIFVDSENICLVIQKAPTWIRSAGIVSI